MEVGNPKLVFNSTWFVIRPSKSLLLDGDKRNGPSKLFLVVVLGAIFCVWAIVDSFDGVNGPLGLVINPHNVFTNKDCITFAYVFVWN